MINKIIRIAKIVIASLLSILIVSFLIIFVNGTCLDKYDDQDKDFRFWMEYIHNDTLLSNVVMPGSHDAGSYDMVWLGETQQYDIQKQIDMGVRYFDLRVNKVDGKLVIFHSVINGVEFLPILEKIKRFISYNPSETLLLDFQHFKGGSQTDVYNLITEYLYNENLLVVNDTHKSDLEFISQLKMSEVRGKCIIFWGDRSSDLSNYVVLRNNDECSNSGMSLNSYYVSEYHYKDYNYLVKNGYPIYFDNIKNKMKNEHKGIFVLQAQLTDGNLIFGPYSKEKTNQKKISEVITSFKDSEDLQYLNVIMRDFLDVNKCEEIINLNYYKGNCDNLITGTYE